MATYLIVAYQTAGGLTLHEAVDQVIRDDAYAEFTLLVPATHPQHLLTWTEGESKSLARKRAEDAAGRLKERGVRLTRVQIGQSDPFLAVSRELREHPGYETIIVSTFPSGISRWLRLDLPTRLEKTFGLPVTHVVVEPEDTSSP